MKINSDYRRTFLPYCIRPLGDEWYVLLNRYYKPVGYLGDSSLPENEYDALLKKHAIKVSFPELLQSLHYGEPREDGYIFLYSGNGFSDGNAEMAYLKKLDALTQLRYQL